MVRMSSSVVAPWLRSLKLLVAAVTRPISSATGGERTVEAFAVQHQADVLHAGHLRQSSEHRFGVRHLRHAFRIDEARDFDALQARGNQAPDQFELGRRRQNLRLALQSIARPHINDFNLSRHR